MRQMIDVPVRMRDNVKLSTDVRLPDGDGPFPTLVLRTPYSNIDPSGYMRYLRAGYAVVAQDCRGRHDSEGRFRPFEEANDGYDLIAWVKSQRWCDGRIGMIGGSYLGTTQLTSAWMSPPGLRAITPRVMGRDLFKDCIYHNGAFCLGLATGWGFGMTGRAGQVHNTTDWASVHKRLPLKGLASFAGFDGATWFDIWLSHPTYDEYWRSVSVEAHYDHFAVPALHMGGWYDFYSDGILRNFTGINTHGGEGARGKQKLIMGPWGHGLNTRNLGILDFGTQAVVDLDGLEARWLDRWVRDIDNGVDREPPVRIFVMGINEWRDENEWPLARATEAPYYLASDGRANSLFGDGRLTTNLPDSTATDSYTYHPDNPVPVLGGSVHDATAGPQDQQPIERRDDMLVYTSDVLTEPVEVTGHVAAVLHAASDCRDTDFIARLCDVYPDGRSIILCDGIVRARFREGLDKEVFLDPGKVYEFIIEMGATSNVFLPGHRIRVDITSSSFPRFARNLNTDEPVATGTRIRSAKQTIHHSRAKPSCVLLPIVPRA